MKVGPNETGDMVGKVHANVSSSHFEGYSDSNATRKKVIMDVFTEGDKYFLSGDMKTATCTSAIVQVTLFTGKGRMS